MGSFIQSGILWGVAIGSLAGYYFLVKNPFKDFSFLEKSMLFALAAIPYVFIGVVFSGILGWGVNIFDEGGKYSLPLFHIVGASAALYFGIRWFKE